MIFLLPKHIQKIEINEILNLYADNNFIKCIFFSPFCRGGRIFVEEKLTCGSPADVFEGSSFVFYSHDLNLLTCIQEEKKFRKQ